MGLIEETEKELASVKTAYLLMVDSYILEKNISFYDSIDNAREAMNENFKQRLDKIKECHDYTLRDYKQYSYSCQIYYSYRGEKYETEFNIGRIQ